MTAQSAEPPRYRVFPWYSSWREEQFACSHCGWKGLGRETFTDEYGVLECPQCEHAVAVVQFPTLKDTEEAAALGNEEAIRELPKFQARISRLQAFEREKLKDTAQLPEIEGDSLDFVWDYVKENGEGFHVIRLGDTEVWRELGFWESVPRFYEIKDLLKRKYGGRFHSLRATGEGEGWLLGDKFMAIDYE